MCGIAGIIHLSDDQRPLERTALERMLEAIKGRGPDAQGVWLDPEGHVGLANARLSTQDLRALAHQPLMDADRSVVVTFNGEIYNYPELRRDLEAQGYAFRTRSDTEVILYAYRAYGEEMLSRFEGQFAFILYDLRRKRVVIARDPIGICPLYYAMHDGYLVVASEPRAILQMPGFPRRLNREAVYYYMVMESTPLGMTLFEHIRYLRSGNSLQFRLFDAPKEIRFADGVFRPDREGSWPRTPEEWAERFRWLLRDAVSRRLTTDKEVGIFLSGGLDSAVVLALMREIDPARRIRSFSFGFEEIESGEVVGELPEARRVSEQFSTDHTEIVLGAEDFVNGMGRFELPAASIAEVIFDTMARRTVEAGVEVVLTGEGSDETFFGYDGYFATIALLSPSYQHLAERYPVRSICPPSVSPGRLTDVFVGGAGDLAIEANRHRIFQGGLEMARSLRDLAQRYVDELETIHPHAEFDKQIMYLDICHKIPEYTLRRIERVTLGNGLEIRVPFLDLRLIATHFQLPMQVRLEQEGEFKWLLKKAVVDLVPREVLTRPKSPFGLPATRSSYFKGSTWIFPKPAIAKLFSRYYSRLEDDLFNGSLMGEGLFQEAYVRERLLRQRDLGTATFDSFLWKLWNLGVWYDRWINCREPG